MVGSVCKDMTDSMTNESSCRVSLSSTNGSWILLGEGDDSCGAGESTSTFEAARFS